jgi:pimeloyl-ACP methyl ester carboxylesterase
MVPQEQQDTKPGPAAPAVPVGLGTRITSALVTPLAPAYGAGLAYLVFRSRRRRHHRQPADLGLTATDLRVPVPAGGGYVDTWLIPGGTDRVVVVGHGIGQSRSASLRHAKLLHDLGYTVCLFDHRNHGGSSNSHAIRHLSELSTTDVVSVVDHLRTMPEYADARYVVYGFSFSTFPVFFALSRADFRVDAIICDSGPTLRIPPLFGRFLDADGIPVPRAFRVKPARLLLEPVFAGLGTAMLGVAWPPPAEGRYAETPVLFLAGADDRVVRPSDVADLAARYGRAELHVLPGVGHLDGLKTDGERYRAIVADFLDRALGERTGGS